MSESAYKIRPGSVCRVPYELARFGGKFVNDWARGDERALNLLPLREWHAVAAEIDVQNFPREQLADIIENNSKALNARDASLDRGAI